MGGGFSGDVGEVQGTTQARKPRSSSFNSYGPEAWASTEPGRYIRTTNVFPLQLRIEYLHHLKHVCVYIYIYRAFSKNLGPHFGSPYNEDHNIFGSILGPPVCGSPHIYISIWSTFEGTTPSAHMTSLGPKKREVQSLSTAAAAGACCQLFLLGGAIKGRFQGALK